MSWFSENYEKACLGGAAVVAVGLGYLIFKGGDNAFTTDTVKANNDVSVPGLDLMNRTKKSLAEPHEVHQADVDGRKVNLFTGVALFSKKDDPGNPVDLLKSDPVHPGIDNKWWLKYNLDPGFSDSPDRDPDKDGFTNREEYVAGTDPTSFKDHPDPVVKLKLVKIKTSQVHIKPTDFGNNQHTFRLENRREGRLNKMGPNPIGPNTIIPFELPFMKDRFKFLDVEEKEVDKNGIKQMVKIWIFEDLKPNKKGDKYRFTQRGELEDLGNRSRGIMDSTLDLLLQALGQGGSPFKLEEGTRFSLPYDPDAKEKPYLLKKIDLDSKRAEVEYTDKDGKKQIHPMPFK